MLLVTDEGILWKTDGRNLIFEHIEVWIYPVQQSEETTKTLTSGLTIFFPLLSDVLFRGQLSPSTPGLQLQPQHPPSNTWEHAHSPCKGKHQLFVCSMRAECNCHAWDPWQLRVEGCVQGSTDSHASAASPGSRMNISSAAADRVATLITLIITTARMLRSQSGRFRKRRGAWDMELVRGTSQAVTLQRRLTWSELAVSVITSKFI